MTVFSKLIKSVISISLFLGIVAGSNGDADENNMLAPGAKNIPTADFNLPHVTFGTAHVLGDGTVRTVDISGLTYTSDGEWDTFIQSLHKVTETTANSHCILLGTNRLTPEHLSEAAQNDRAVTLRLLRRIRRAPESGGHGSGSSD